MDEFNEQWLALFMKSLVLEETDHVEVDIESAQKFPLTNTTASYFHIYK